MFNELEKKILDRIQQHINLSENIYTDLAIELGISEEKLLLTLQDLSSRNILKNISAIFDANSLGYHSVLVACRVNEERLSSVAAEISKHSGVSHNYSRKNFYNLWYTLTLPVNISLYDEVVLMMTDLKLKDYILFWAEKKIKINVGLPFMDKDKKRFSPLALDEKTRTNKFISSKQKKIVRFLLLGLPFEKQPIQKLLQKNDIDLKEEEIIAEAHNLFKTGIMRRYSAILKQEESGYTNNALVVWKAEPKENIVKKISYDIPEISHVYFRKAEGAKWDYPLFTMVHAVNKNALLSTIKKFQDLSGLREYLILETLTRFKKQSISYFSEYFTKREKENLND